MNKQYVIQWKSRSNGRAGKGSKTFAQEEAEHLVAELNQEYPQIQHELAEAEPAGPPEKDPALEPARASRLEPPPAAALAPAGEFESRH